MKRLLVLMMVASVLVVIPAGSAVGSDVECGYVITSDFKLMHDLVDCPGDGLVVGASGITIDLGGHTIDGDETTGSVVGGAGVRIADPYGGVELRNGVIREFSQAVQLDRTSGNHVWKLIVVDNSRGIDLSLSEDNVVEKNEARDQRGDGIRIDVSNHNVVQKNLVVGNVFGISVSNSSSGNLVAKNEVVDGVFAISVFSNSDDTTVEKNLVQGNARNGILIQSQSDGALVTKNTSSGNGWDGVLVEAGEGPFSGLPQGTVIEKNTANDNGDDGIDTDSSETTLTKNTTNGNTDLGIEAVAGVDDGGGNKAAGNGNPNECVNVLCK